jgi:type II secretory ATPase GspE/PulE/Tfp pilus assembly ATPase PilB-like protein
MDSQFPINRIAHLFPGLEDHGPANADLAAFTNAVIEFSYTECPDDSDTDAERTTENSPMVRLLMLAVREAHQEGAESVVIEPGQNAVAVHFKYPDGRSVERDSPPKRLMGAILAAVHWIAGDSAEIALADKRVAIAFTYTPHGPGVSLTILGDAPPTP